MERIVGQNLAASSVKLSHMGFIWLEEAKRETRSNYYEKAKGRFALPSVAGEKVLFKAHIDARSVLASTVQCKRVFQPDSIERNSPPCASVAPLLVRPHA